MDRRRVSERVAENISRSILVAGADTSHIARAARMDAAEFSARLSSGADLTLGELVRVGGALRVSPGSLLTEVTA